MSEMAGASEVPQMCLERLADVHLSVLSFSKAHAVGGGDDPTMPSLSMSLDAGRRLTLKGRLVPTTLKILKSHPCSLRAGAEAAVRDDDDVGDVIGVDEAVAVEVAAVQRRYMAWVHHHSDVVGGLASVVQVGLSYPPP
ncbi:MAG: hypothetical protein IPI35_32710 [Deltaproteobacteria bacterium]|nr:hypothetical protein [Deltaproteobacteria bacterium]